MAAPKPRPARLKLLEGRAPGRDSGGRPVAAPPAFRRQAPPKPGGMSADAERLWDEVVAELPRLELLKELDGPALQIACETYARWYQARRMRQRRGLTVQAAQGRLMPAPWVGIEERASREFRAWCAEFGLTPSAEMRLSKEAGGGDEEDDPFA